MKVFRYFSCFFFFVTLVFAKDIVTLKEVSIVEYREIETPINKIQFEKNFQKKYLVKEFDYSPKEKEIKSTINLSFFKKIISKFIQFLYSKNVNIFLKIIKFLAFGLILLFFCVKIFNINIVSFFYERENFSETSWYKNVENLENIPFAMLIQEFIQKKQFRIAIRYYYLWLLKKMADKEHILWDNEKTNSDYLLEISNEKLRKEFSYLSYLYDHIWYGEKELETQTFEKVQIAFQKTIQTL